MPFIEFLLCARRSSKCLMSITYSSQHLKVQTIISILYTSERRFSYVKYLFQGHLAYQCWDKASVPGTLAGGLKGHPFNPVPYCRDRRNQTDPHLNFSSIVKTVVKFTACYSELIHGRVTWAVRAFCPGRFNVLGLMFFSFYSLDILYNFSARGSPFSLCIGSCKCCSSS